MGFDKFSLGSKKNIKKEINVDVTYKHIIGFFLILILLVMVIMVILSKLNIGVDERSLECKNGTIETITYGKEFYCGEHYTVLEGAISDSSYKHIQNIIKNGE